MENTQITIDDLVSSYQKEISSLIHNKIIIGIQVEKLNSQLELLIQENNELKTKVHKLEKIPLKRGIKTSEDNFE